MVVASDSNNTSPLPSPPSSPSFPLPVDEKKKKKNSSSGAARDGISSAEDLRRVCDKYRAFLDASIGLGRNLWTQYDTGLMWWGLAVLLMATAALALRAVASAEQAAAAAEAGVGAGARVKVTARTRAIHKTMMTVDGGGVALTGSGGGGFSSAWRFMGLGGSAGERVRVS